MEPKTTTEVKKQSTLKGILIGGGIGLLVAILAYFIGAQMGRSEVQGQLTTANAQVQEARTEAAKSQEVNELLRARGFLTDAAVSLERRNYGSANENLRRSNQMLQQVDAAAVGVDTAQLEQIDEAITAIDLTVQSDVGAQRNQVLDLASQLGRLVPEPAAAPDTAPPAGAGAPLP